MRATEFEYRHQTLLHLLVVGLAFLAYAFQPDDIVWALVRHHTTDRALLERLVFGIGTLMIVGSAAVQTWATAYRLPLSGNASALTACDGPYRYVQYPLYMGRILFALGLGLLAPAVGTFVLLLGEALLVLRLFNCDRSLTSNFYREYRRRVPLFFPSFHPRFPNQGFGANWAEAAPKWGLGVTMIVFTWTLQDRLAEVLAVTSLLLWVALNIPNFIRANRSDRNA